MTATASPLRFAVLAYGPERRLHREATVALLTMREFAPRHADVIVLTDCPAMYQWMSNHVTIESLNATTIRAWRGPSDDRFRPKIEAIRALGSNGAHVVLADVDTMAQRPLSPLVEHLEGGGFVLYEREYCIAAPPRRGDRRLRHEIVGHTWSGITADSNTWMWNGGVIGVPGVHYGVIDRTLEAFDQMRTASRHFALEQLAYSIVFSAFGPVRAADDLFVHYWANRAWFDRRIDRFLGDALMQGLTPQLAGERLRHDPIRGKRDGRLPTWQRRVMRLLRIESHDDAERLD
jgi:hypothetical protein